ncbi:MAG: hypothetical protein CMF59_12635 [Leptospiraceae bacterium]|nr:hypothetical protein [Leptospiraceae bacterium]
MYVTEEEAKQKECKPKEIALAIAAVTGNATGSPMCTASDCMMWRWTGYRNPRKDGISQESNAHTGYCGLAGRPE